MKRKLINNSECQQNQQNEQLSLISNHWT